MPPGKRLWYDTADIAALRQGEKERADTMQVNAAALSTLIIAGYEPDAAAKAVLSGDVTQLLAHHTGMVSVQMQAPGTGTTPTGGTP